MGRLKEQNDIFAFGSDGSGVTIWEEESFIFIQSINIPPTLQDKINNAFWPCYNNPCLGVNQKGEALNIVSQGNANLLFSQWNIKAKTLDIVTIKVDKIYDVILDLDGGKTFALIWLNDTFKNNTKFTPIIDIWTIEGSLKYSFSTNLTLARSNFANSDAKKISGKESIILSVMTGENEGTLLVFDYVKREKLTIQKMKANAFIKIAPIDNTIDFYALTKPVKSIAKYKYLDFSEEGIFEIFPQELPLADQSSSISQVPNTKYLLIQATGKKAIYDFEKNLNVFNGTQNSSIEDFNQNFAIFFIDDQFILGKD